MGRWADLLTEMRASPANVRFRDLRRLVEHLGYVERRQIGSHRIYRHAKMPDPPLINLQEGRAGKAKPYQVRQVLAIVDAYGLEVEP